MHTLAPAATADQESAAAHRLIDAYATKALEKGDTNDKVRVLEILARVDPARTLELTEGKTLTEPFLKAMIRTRVSAALLESAPDEAYAVAESIDDPAARALALLKAADVLPATEKAKKQELLDHALIGAKAAREPTGMRTLLMGEVAEHWLDMGLTEKGKALLREIQPDAEQLPGAAWAGYAKGAFAERLCQIDLDAALKLTKNLSDASEFDRHHGNIAHELAGKDPAAAERVLGMVKNPFQHDDSVVRVVYRMAPADLARARRLATTAVDPVMRGFALGMGALGLANAKKMADATVLLREALATLETAGGVRRIAHAESVRPCRHVRRPRGGGRTDRPRARRRDVLAGPLAAIPAKVARQRKRSEHRVRLAGGTLPGSVRPRRGPRAHDAPRRAGSIGRGTVDRAWARLRRGCGDRPCVGRAARGTTAGRPRPEGAKYEERRPPGRRGRARAAWRGPLAVSAKPPRLPLGGRHRGRRRRPVNGGR